MFFKDCWSVDLFTCGCVPGFPWTTPGACYACCVLTWVFVWLRWWRWFSAVDWWGTEKWSPLPTSHRWVMFEKCVCVCVFVRIRVVKGVTVLTQSLINEPLFSRRAHYGLSCSGSVFFRIEKIIYSPTYFKQRCKGSIAAATRTQTVFEMERLYCRRFKWWGPIAN